MVAGGETIDNCRIFLLQAVRTFFRYRLVLRENRGCHNENCTEYQDQSLHCNRLTVKHIRIIQEERALCPLFSSE